MRDTHVRLHLLGPPRLSTPMGREVPLSRKAWGLLAYLHQASPRAVGRAELAALLWPESQGPQGRASLRTELATLRKAMAICGYPRINATKETVQLLLPKDA
ncbi:MAG: winged helix-turn-helix domain-containing protein, partial [Pseudomonadota bacterium]